MWAGVCGPRVRTGQGGQRVRGAGRGRGQSVGRDSEVMAGEDLRETALFANRHEAFADQDLRYRYQKIQRGSVTRSNIDIYICKNKQHRLRTWSLKALVIQSKHFVTNQHLVI